MNAPHVVQYRSRGAVLAAGLIAVAMRTPAAGQAGTPEARAADGAAPLVQPAPAPGTPLPAGRSAGKPRGLTPEIESFLKNLIQTYASAESYRDHGRVKLIQKTGRVTITTETPMELTFARPNRLLLDAGQYVISADGKALRTIAPQMLQFTEMKAPERLEKRNLAAGSVLGGTDEGHPELIDFLIQPDAHSQLLREMTSVAWEPDATAAGRPCRVLAYETLQGTKIVNFIDAERMVLLKVEAASAPPAESGAPAPRVNLTYELTPVELNLPLEPAAFACPLPAGSKRVENIGQSAEPGDPGADPPTERPVPVIVGKDAPAISGKDLAGKMLAPGDLDGRIVLLFFWSIRGGQHCIGSLPLMQQIADEFAKHREFVVLGINADAEATDTVKQLMDLKKATFRTVVDDALSLHRAFQLEGVPSFVLIGPDGKVKWAKLGGGPSLKADLIAEIGKLIATEPGKQDPK